MSAELIVSPDDAVRRLQKGNQRFVTGHPSHPSSSSKDRMLLLDGQTPFTTVISCSDSRVPPEIIFDCGIGELFVIRTAGNILDTVGMGTLIYAVVHLNCPLVVVLGHESCGAVTAALQSDEILVGEPATIQALIAQIRSQIPLTLAVNQEGKSQLNSAIRENINTTIDTISQMTEISSRIESGTLAILPAYYSLSTGMVDFE